MKLYLSQYIYTYLIEIRYDPHMSSANFPEVVFRYEIHTNRELRRTSP